MLKSMLVDLKQPCVVCGEPVGIFLLNQDDGLKMCSNTSCDWPFCEDSMELYNFSNMKLTDVSLEGPCSSVDIDLIDAHVQSKQPVLQTHSSEDLSPSEIIDLSDDNVVFKKPRNAAKALAANEEKHLFSSVMKLQNKWRNMRNYHGLPITTPWMQRQLELSKQRGVLPNSKLDEDSTQSMIPQYSMKISNENEGIPTIQIQILPYNNESESEGSEVVSEDNV